MAPRSPPIKLVETSIEGPVTADFGGTADDAVLTGTLLGPDGAPCTISAANHIFDTGTIGLPGTSGTISGCYPIPAIARRRQY